MNRSVAGAAVLLVSACVSATQVTPIGPRRPSRPEGCALDLFPTTPPPYQSTPIAQARTECVPERRKACLEQLRAEACRAGADAIIGMKESTTDLNMFVEATFIAKGPPVKDCDPICSPGFVCHSGQCIPQCNPPCEAGEVCNRNRACEPAAGPPPAAPPPPPPPPQ